MELTDEKRKQIEQQVRDCGYVFPFGKHKGDDLYSVLKYDRPYVAWLVLNTVYEYSSFHWYINDDILQGLLQIVENANYCINPTDGSVYQERKKIPKSDYRSMKQISEHFDAVTNYEVNDDFQIWYYYDKM